MEVLLWGCHFPLAPAQRRGTTRKVHPSSSPRWQLDRPDERLLVGGLPALAMKHTTLQLRTSGSPRFALLPQQTTGVAAFCRTRVWGNMHSGAEKSHACGSENGAGMLDGPILAGLGALPAGTTEEKEGRDGRHSSSSRGPMPSKRQQPGRSRGTFQGAGGQPSLSPRYGWICSPLTSGDGGGGNSGTGRLGDAALRDVLVIKEKPDPGRWDALLPPPSSAAGSPLPPNKKAASSTVVAKMASLVKTLLAGSLFAFASVHAGVATHRSSPRDSVLRARSGPVVTVKNGSYEGVHSAEYDQDFFLGMRYSQVRPTSVTHSHECCCCSFTDEHRSYVHSQQSASPSHSP